MATFSLRVAEETRDAASEVLADVVQSDSVKCNRNYSS